MRRKLRTLLRALAATLVLVFIAWVALDRLTSPSRWPNPNGYDEFVRAGQMVTRTLDGHGDLGDYRDLTLESLRAFAATNAEALKIARGALDRECCVPVTIRPNVKGARPCSILPRVRMNSKREKNQRASQTWCPPILRRSREIHSRKPIFRYEPYLLSAINRPCRAGLGYAHLREQR